MKKLLSLLMAVFAVALVSCTDTDDLQSSQPQSESILRTKMLLKHIWLLRHL